MASPLDFGAGGGNSVSNASRADSGFGNLNYGGFGGVSFGTTSTLDQSTIVIVAAIAGVVVLAWLLRGKR